MRQLQVSSIQGLLWLYQPFSPHAACCHISAVSEIGVHVLFVVACGVQVSAIASTGVQVSAVSLTDVHVSGVIGSGSHFFVALIVTLDCALQLTAAGVWRTTDTLAEDVALDEIMTRNTP
jgi:hypothetical protein